MFKNINYSFCYLSDFSGFEMTDTVQNNLAICGKYTIWPNIDLLSKGSVFKINIFEPY